MKILSNKEYRRLMNKIDTLTKDNDCANRELDKMKGNKPSDCKSNEGGDFCSICEFGYLRMRNPFGADFTLAVKRCLARILRGKKITN